jgi:hypothetical protein
MTSLSSSKIGIIIDVQVNFQFSKQGAFHSSLRDVLPYDYSPRSDSLVYPGLCCVYVRRVYFIIIRENSKMCNIIKRLWVKIYPKSFLLNLSQRAF